MELRRSDWVNRGQAGIQMVGALFTRFLAELRPHSRIARGRLAQTLEENPHIEARTTYHKRKPSSSIKLVDDLGRMTAKKTGIEGLVRIDQIKKMMRHTMPGG